MKIAITLADLAIYDDETGEETSLTELIPDESLASSTVVGYAVRQITELEAVEPEEPDGIDELFDEFDNLIW